MAYSSTSRKFLYCCLILPFILAACSNEDDTSQAVAVEKKPEVRKVISARRPSSKRESIQKVIPIGFIQDYLVAKRALSDKDYASAIDNLNKAINGNNDEKLILTVNGKRYGSYLPHYYLGTAAYLVGDCESALYQWNISLKQGVIQKTQNYNYLEKAMEVCKSRN